MKDEWYADKRDLIKWGGIAHLCNTTGVNHVIQAAYFRESPRLTLQFNSEEVLLPSAVVSHFRDIEGIRSLGTNIGVTIEVVKSEFNKQSREAYTEAICQLIQRHRQRQIVFLDTDTGLATKNAKAEHIKPEEIYLIWQSLKRGDILVLYQHKFREKNWRQIRKEQFAEACNLNKGRISEWSAPKIADDVVFFFCEK